MLESSTAIRPRWQERVFAKLQRGAYRTRRRERKAFLRVQRFLPRPSVPRGLIRGGP